MRRREDLLCRNLTSFKRLYCLALTQYAPPGDRSGVDALGRRPYPAR